MIDGPHLQGFRQDRVIGIRAGLCHHLDGLHKGKCLVIGQNADQFGDDQGRVRIVDLDHGVVVHSPQIALARLHLPEDQLCGIADHKVLLIEPQDPARLVGIVGIDKQREVLLDRPLIKFDPVVHYRAVRTLKVEQPELVDAAVVTGYTHFIHSGSDLASAKIYIKAYFCQILPGIPLHPVVPAHLLEMIRK